MKSESKSRSKRMRVVVGREVVNAEAAGDEGKGRKSVLDNIVSDTYVDEVGGSGGKCVGIEEVSVGKKGLVCGQRRK